LRRFLKLSTYVPVIYWAGTYLARFLLFALVRWNISGRERIPATGGLLLVSNHLNNIDPIILGAATPRRRIRFMAKVELFKWPFGIFTRLYGAFPVRRFEADVGAMLNAERILRRGETLGMFPEGTRSKTGYIGRPHPGTALIAMRTGATVLPCAITGTEQLGNPLNLLRRPAFRVQFAEPLTIPRVKRPTEAQVVELTDQLFAEICKLLPPQYLAAYTGSATSTQEHDGSDPPG